MVRNMVHENKGKHRALVPHKGELNGRMKKLVVAVLMFALLTTIATPFTMATVNFLQNPEKSNYTEGHGNITYPTITHRTNEKGFSRSIFLGDVNDDKKSYVVNEN